MTGSPTGNGHTNSPARRSATTDPGIPDEIARRFEAIVFDWDGTAVPDRNADASRVRHLVEELCANGVDIAVVTGTHVENVDAQLQARPHGPGHLSLLVNRGSEVFDVGTSGPTLVYRRVATEDEERALDKAAARTLELLEQRGMQAAIVSTRLNRRKIDLIPEPEWVDPAKAQIAELLAAVRTRLHTAGISDLSEVVALALHEGESAGLRSARVTSDAKHVEIGLTDKTDSARWIFDVLWRRGISPEQTMIVGDEFGELGGVPGSDSLLLVPQGLRATAVSVGVEPTRVPARVLHVGGGPQAFLSLLRDQLTRRQNGEIPSVDPDPAWAIGVSGFDARMERVHEALLTVADARIGTSGHPPIPHRASRARVLASLYDGVGPESQLLSCPVWNTVWRSGTRTNGLQRMLDLHTGTLHVRLATGSTTASAVVLSSLARPGTVLVRTETTGSVLDETTLLREPLDRSITDHDSNDGRAWMVVDAPPGGVAAAIKSGRLRHHGKLKNVDRVGSYRLEANSKPVIADASRVVQEVSKEGFEKLLIEHRVAWARRWQGADVRVEGDPKLQLAIRFALFHLMSSVADEGEAAVGARGLSGQAYRGHVFWDSDVFVLPFLAATHPAAARAMLEYRIRRLPAAKETAARLGRRGARFPWESARDGYDVTPHSMRDWAGSIVPVRTGELEEHIVADVAWAADHYIAWTGDQTFAAGPGCDLLVETARYWASRIRLDEDGRGHIEGVIGPDEYHEEVDDNAFTNVMARWNLRRAAGLAIGRDDVGDEIERWLELADRLVDGYQFSTNLYEQFAGFFDLEPLLIKDEAPRRPIAADMLLGRERVRATQIVKQSDVLMLHHLLPGEVAPGSLEPNLDYYEPRTAHGSSLSPGIHASLLARAGRLEEAVEALQLTSRIDLEDLTGTSAGGLHLAAMGSLWQAIAFGFFGLEPSDGVLDIDPHIPSMWRSLDLTVSFRGNRVSLRAERDRLLAFAESPTPIRIAKAEPIWLGPEGLEVPLPSD
jgi:hydroxymethylpyrimidine pyrophosphatase-like HAD family hydrolase